jgi:hypothetical protein
MIDLLSTTTEVIYIDGNVDITENPTIIQEWRIQCKI